MTRRKADSETKNWIRNASDELAVRKGYRFDLERATFVVDWIQDFLVLYEGEHADEPLILRDWQLECTMRMFGWVGFSEHWGREVRRFRESSIWVPKKNKKSPTLAAWALYMLIGDGEAGQKVYLAAKDGNQAKELAGKHVIEMLKRSEALMAECHVDEKACRVAHLPTSSFLMTLSSANERHAKAKEGLNGSVFKDETHVLDRKFINRINRAGISRAEPLDVEVSTAGNDPEGYGKERFDLAESVIAGRVEQPTLFAAVYAAPQDVTHEQIAEDPLKYGRMANPAMGHTVNPEEFLADYHASKTSVTKMQDFLMYRCNVWCGSSAPWLNPLAWSACHEPYSIDDLRGQVAYGGFDRAWVKDFAAWLLMFPDGDVYRQLVWFWMPEETARARAHLASYLDWADRGFLKLVPGKTISRAQLVDDIVEICEPFKVRGFAYDPYRLQGEAEEIEDRTGAKGFSFSQTTQNFAAPTAQYETLVIDGDLKNDGHPILAWQAGHVQVYRNANGNMRPVREDKDDHRTIDGIVAGVMALAMAASGDDGGSVYEDRGVMAF